MKGFTGVTGEPLFLWVFDAADNMAIDTIWQKYTFRQKSGVLPDNMNFVELHT